MFILIDKHLGSPLHMPGNILSALQTLTHLIIVTTLSCRCYDYLHFKMRKWRQEWLITCPRSHSQFTTFLGFKSRPQLSADSHHAEFHHNFQNMCKIPELLMLFSPLQPPLFFFLAEPQGLQDLSSPTRD